MSVFGSGDYDRKKKVPVVCLAGCAVVSVFGSGDYDRKKKFQSSVWWVVLLCQFLVLGITTRKKKVPVVCLAGCAVVSNFCSGDLKRSTSGDKRYLLDL